MRYPLRHITGSFMVLLLCACASTGSDPYPSLEIRDVEREAAATEFIPDRELINPPAPIPPPPDPALLRRLDKLLTQARQSHGRFLSATPATERAVRAGGHAASDSQAKSDALIALANLESIRSETAIPLGDLDEIYADAGVARAQRQSIIATRNSVNRMVAEEDATLARLSSRISL